MNRKHNAFTLIELLVVIAIIAILAAILFPVFAQAKNAAKTAATISNQKQLGLAVQMYSADYDDMTPMYEYTGPDGSAWYFGRIIYPYVKNANIFFDASTGTTPGNLDTTGDWGLSKADGGWTLNHNLSLNGGGLFGYWSGSSYVYGRSLSNQENIASRAALVTTSRPGVGGAYGYYQFLNWVALSPNYNDANDFWANLTYNAAKRHNNANIVSYADGHAGKAQAGRIYVPKGGDFAQHYSKPEVRQFWGYWYSATE